MNDYQRQQQAILGRNNLTLTTMFESVKDAITSKGYQVELINKKESLELEIAITLADLPDFKAAIDIGSTYGGSKGQFWFEDSRKIVRPTGKDFYGDDRFLYDSYKFVDMVQNDILFECGLAKADYRVELYQLRKEFKATKSAKLILNDLLPRLDIYKKVVTLASPAIDIKIQEEAEYLELCNKLQKLTKYPSRVQHSIETHSFTIEGIGDISLSPYGSITLKKELTNEELLTLIA